jgi:NADH:flavin oxidoreductase / NADH oxidase family
VEPLPRLVRACEDPGVAETPPYPLLFSEWQIRNTTVPNRIVFAPTCPTWVADPYEGVFTDQAVAYYEERAKGGCGLIIIGGTIIHREALYSEFIFPGLWDDKQIAGLAKWPTPSTGTAASSPASCCMSGSARCPS